MAAPTGIDWDWAQRSGGRLSARQKRQLIAPLVRTVIRYPPVRLRLMTARTSGLSIDLDTLSWPDSALANDAVAEARDVLPPYLLDHSYRTYLFGLLLAQAGAVAVDHELVFVASMLHDTRLENLPAGRCFAVAGGEHARDFCLERGVEADRAGAVAAAVAAHITVGALEEPGDPGGFVSGGAFADLTGVGLQHASRAWVDAVHRAFPRHHAGRAILEPWGRNAAAVPDGRAHWLNRYAAFPLLVRAAPFKDWAG